MSLASSLARLHEAIPQRADAVLRGAITGVQGPVLEARGVAGSVGDLCWVETSSGERPVQIVGFHESRARLLPYDSTDGVRPGSAVRCTQKPWDVPVGPALLGRVLDGLARPMDGLGPVVATARRPVHGPAPDALSRPPILEPMQTGVRAIDLMTTIGRGQRLGIFAGSGVGKSTLLGMLLSNCDADVFVIALIGERGREVRQFLDDNLPEEARRRTVVVAATSDRPPLQRLSGAHVAATIAESFRDQGNNVLVVMDSVTRFAMAIRDAGLAAGEPPSTRGYPPSLYTEIPRLAERFGTASTGSITALLTVLTEGDDLHDPVSDCLRGILDGHIVLSRSLADRGHYPPIDTLRSLSRLMPQVIQPEHAELARTLREWIALLEDHRDVVELGAYKRGENPRLDLVLSRKTALDTLLRQGVDESTTLDEGLHALRMLLRGARQ